ncbi:MAG: cytochrome c oxidase subunit I [Flavobacteriales bacterium]|jgi:cytochrome c oxidase subunit I|nr:cytochrome c oxidase subunit I [Flavobacteriales bacterium]
MSTETQANTEHHAHDEHHHEETFITKYVFSQDHKMISKQFLLTGMFMAVIGMIMSTLFRMQLGWQGESFKIFSWLLGDRWAPDGVMDSNIYLALVTIHGTIMVFFLLTAGLSGTFANFLIPLQIGARDMASGFLNMLSYWFFFISSCIMFGSIFIETGPASGGWTIYPPLSALPEAMPGSGLGMTLWLLSMTLFVVSSLLGGLNYVITIINLRTKGMSMLRLPLSIWALFVTAVLGILSFPVLVSAVLLLMADRLLGTSFYLSDIFINGQVLDFHGGSPILYEHLFWFLGHPEVYIVLLPALGLSSEIIATNSRKPIFGYRAMIGSILAIGFLSFIVWGHHMFMTGMNPFLGAVFTFTTLLIAIPSAVKAFNYITTLWKGNIVYTPAMLFAVAMVSTFVTGGVTGIILADSALDIAIHDTLFVTAHFHVVMGLSSVMAMFGGVYHWFPKMYGRMMNTKLGYAHFWLTFIAAYGVFFPMHFTGIMGVPRRYYTNSELPMFDAALPLDLIISMFAILGAFAQAIFFFNFFYSIFRGQKAIKNPWRANTLEWTTPVIPGHGNWPGDLPVVHRWAYDYSKPGKPEDFVVQTVPLEDGEEDGGGH